jgi:hypothetical protein
MLNLGSSPLQTSLSSFTRFEEAVEKGKKEGDVQFCGTPVRWIRESLGNCEQLTVMSDMFPESGMTSSCHQYNTYLMDVILN